MWIFTLMTVKFTGKKTDSDNKTVVNRIWLTVGSW